MSTVTSSGTQAAVIGTEHTLGAAVNTAGTYLLVVDLINLVDGDTVELRLKRSALGAGTVRVLYAQVYSDVPPADNLMQASVPVPIPTNGGLTATLKQTNGTGRSFPWALEAL